MSIRSLIVKLLLVMMAILPCAALAQTANLWIDTTGGTCTRQGTPATYNDAAACASMSAAISACTAGDTIRMKAGTYGAQSINVTKTTPGCTVIAETTTTIGALTTNGAWYEIQNIVGSSGSGWSSSGANHITCRDCSFDGGGSEAYVSWTGRYNNISWIGGSLKNIVVGPGEATAFLIFNAGTTLLVDGVTFDNVDMNSNPGDHFEVIRVDGDIDGLTIRNSTFTNNLYNTSTIFFSSVQNLDGGAPTNFVSENNFFGSGDNAAFQENLSFTGSNCTNWTFRYNTFRVVQTAGFTDGDCPTLVNVVWVGNLGPLEWSCEGTSYTDNVWYGASGSACDASDSVVTTASVNFDTDGFHILTGSSAIGAGGTGANCIATDHDGNARSSPCDAGGHEFGAGGGGPTTQTNFRLLDIGSWLLLGSLLAGLLFKGIRHGTNYSSGRWYAAGRRPRLVAQRAVH